MGMRLVLPIGSIAMVLAAMLAGILLHAEPVQARPAPVATEATLAR
jgi:hypothetical protein